MNETLPILKNVTAELEAKPGSSEIEAMPLQQDVSDSEAACEQSSPPKQWRSLEELAETPEFEDMLHREFPRHAAVWDSGLDRRKFLTVAGASMGLAGLTACTKQPPESIIPYVRQPEEIVPGKPLFFATTTTLLGHALGLLAESHMGRPTKVEGHPDHPASLGGSDSIAQASVLDLYDPDRSQAVLHLGRIRSWDAFVTEITAAVESFKARGGAGLRILSGTSSSPTMGALMTELLAEMPEARWHQFESAATDNARTGIRQALGADLAPCCDLERAEVVLSIDSDFLGSGVTAIRYSRDFSKRRQVRDVEKLKQDGMSRLYAVDTEPTATSAAADHRLALNPTEISHFVVALAAQLGVVEAEAQGFDSGPKAAWVEEVAADLQANAGASLVIAGEYSDPEIQTLVCAINAKLGNVGTTVTYRDSIELHPADEPLDQASSFAELLADMEAGEVELLLMLEVNPVYASAADQDFAAALQKVNLRIHFGLYDDETAEHCQWHIPASHYLESWGDARAFDGTVSLSQPLIEPLYDSKTALHLVAAFLGRPLATDRELVQDHWKQQHEAGAVGAGESFDRFWRRIVHEGMIPDSAGEARQVAIQEGAVQSAAQALTERSASGLELVFRPDCNVFDGRFANNSWLQECPRTMTKLTWDNALLMSPRTARELGLGDLVKGNDQSKRAPLVTLTVGSNTLELPVWVLPGHADGCLTLNLGFGRTRGGKVAQGAGFNACLVRGSDALWRVSSGVSVTPARGKYLLASTQDHHSMEGRHLVRMADLEDYLHDPKHAGAHHHHGPVDITLMDGEDFPYDGYAWGMCVDLTACTGCNTCVVACQAENNIPAVGKDQVALGREMHWMRLDRYYMGEDADHVDGFVFQPVSCVHCEQAPCEVVCPVAATVHSDEGLNDMVYNRCVGTRYCSNNCPYKVRRFNFLLYADFETPSLQLGRNPNVTVRSRGVMEKCTYCVQRINEARITAKRENRKIRDGEIKTACQGACPSDAIAFGDINDPNSKVSQFKSSPMDFTLLEELGNKPRTTYIGRVSNPNPKLVERLGGKKKHAEKGHH